MIFAPIRKYQVVLTIRRFWEQEDLASHIIKKVGHLAIRHWWLFIISGCSGQLAEKYPPCWSTATINKGHGLRYGNVRLWEAFILERIETITQEKKVLIYYFKDSIDSTYKYCTYYINIIAQLFFIKKQTIHVKFNIP